MVNLVRAHALAAAAAAAALLLSQLVWPLMEPSRSPLFLAAVVVSAWGTEVLAPDSSRRRLPY
jgi:hypothetical protein